MKNEDGTYSKVKNPDAYTPWAVRSMCCRLQLDLTQLTKRWNGLFGSAEMTWSIWVVTLNMARIWYNFKWDKEGFKDRVAYLMDKAKESLEIKRQVIATIILSWKYWFNNLFWLFVSREYNQPDYIISLKIYKWKNF